ncbi:fumarylacetoacetate hydrolase family protein [Thermosulfurimonas sp. F29]|uniref:fumarylacetoacetate hydrolase family protein n=1 Tax=Thermosulfurimonas sp. F29 TaxID=2867247 RepID=UPI001C83C581|nr:fumarylacetoacetate hydrolase family protein [Thermosulfurimonas sp. F29]MBX6422994.1 fumarylacetoacetate hydrolase family protein [Thermosulfurimonas sp. F29]
MKIVRFRWRDLEGWGRLEGERILGLPGVEEAVRVPEEGVPLTEVRLLPPTVPTKIVAVGLNYRDHAEELGLPVPDEPLIFLKPPSAVIGPEDPILLPRKIGRVDYEAELAVVIGKVTRKIRPEEASRHILGYTCFNDVTARDLQKKDGQWTRAKSFDTFAPLGPWIETDLDPSALRIRAYLNGRIVQDSSTEKLIFPVNELVSFISHIMTLYPGDVIATGTPPGVGPLSPGDVVEVEVEGVGRLANFVRES